MGFFSFMFPDRKKKFLAKLEQAINKVKHGTYNYIYIDLLKRYDEKEAGMLAAALTNTMFNEESVGEEAVAYRNDKAELLEEELLKLRGNSTIGNMVADAIQIKASLIFNNQLSGTIDMNFGKSIEILKKLEFYKNPDSIARPKLFFTKADKYFTVSLRKVKYL